MGSVIGSNVLNAGSRDLTEEQMEQRAVSADVARNIRKVADNNGYSLDDVNPTSGNGARQALEEVRNQQVRDVVNLAKKLKKQLDPRQAETLEQLLEDYSAAEAAIAAGKRKVSTKVTADQYDAVKRLVTPYKEGNALLQTLLGTNVVTDLFKDGMKGGLSQWTDLFNPLLTSGHSYDPTRVGNVVLGGLPLMTYGIDSVIPQAAIVLGGQAIDKVLGGKGGTRRKLVKRFVKLNEGNDGLGTPTGPSLIAQAQQAERQEEIDAQEAAAQKQENTDAFNEFEGDVHDKSPQGEIYLRTGLNSAGLRSLLDHMAEHYGDRPAIARWIEATQRNLAGEYNQIKGLNEWMGILNSILSSHARLDSLRVNDPENNAARTKRRLAGFGPSASQSSAGTAQQQQPQGRSPAEQSGIDANNALADRLLNGMESDQSIPEAQKELLRTALLELGARSPDGRRGNIGANGQPLQNALDIVERLRASGVMPRYINDYIMPYVQRVAQQNAGRSARGQQQQQPTSTGTDLAFDEDFDASKPALTDNVPTGAVSGTPLENSLAGQSFDQDLAQQGNTGVLATPPAQQPQPQSPFNMKSLVNKMFGSQPATPDQVKAQLPELRAVFEIGKKGTKYENGIQDIDTALALAKALNITVKMFDDQKAMISDYGKSNNEMVRGAFTRGQSNQEGTVWALNPNAYAPKLGRVTDLLGLTTLLHEIGHGIATGPSGFGFTNEIDAKGYNDLTGQRPLYNSRSFESALMPYLETEGAKNKSAIVKELINLQDKVEVYLENNPKEKREIRTLASAIEYFEQEKKAHAELLGSEDNFMQQAFKDHKKKLDNHRTYIRSLKEIAVDPVWVYLANPKLAKKVMPLTTKVLQEQFRNAQNPRIQFFSHPFAVSLAVVLAMMLNGRTEEEEEQQRQQMPAGALSPQAGALSQQQVA
jgi:hypothetical protein